MENTDTMHLEAAPMKHVMRDMWRNRRWVVFVLVIAVIYVLLSSAFIRLFENHWSFWHASYFTVINMTTVGFGDVVPFTRWGKVIAGFNAFIGLSLFGFLVAVFALALQPTGWSPKPTPLGEMKAPEQDSLTNTLKAQNSVATLLDSLGG